MDVNFKIYSLGALINRAEMLEAKYSDENRVNLISKLNKISDSCRYVSIESITLSEPELRLLQLL